MYGNESKTMNRYISLYRNLHSTNCDAIYIMVSMLLYSFDAYCRTHPIIYHSLYQTPMWLDLHTHILLYYAVLCTYPKMFRAFNNKLHTIPTDNAHTLGNFTRHFYYLKSEGIQSKNIILNTKIPRKFIVAREHTATHRELLLL